MKKSSFLCWVLLMAITVVFSSCEKDDEDVGNSDLIGSWKLTEQVYISSSGEQEVWYLDDPKSPVIYTFKSDNTLTLKEGSDIIINAIWRLNGKKLQIIHPNVPEEEGHIEEAEIVTLNDKELILICQEDDGHSELIFEKL